LPFRSELFDLVVSWHAAYYMKPESGTFSEHVREMARVTKRSGHIVLSVPMPTSFIFDGATREKSRGDFLDGISYFNITNDPFGMRNGVTFAQITDISVFASSLQENLGLSVAVGEEMGNWFGFRYDWWDLVLSSKQSSAS